MVLRELEVFLLVVQMQNEKKADFEKNFVNVKKILPVASLVQMCRSR